MVDGEKSIQNRDMILGMKTKIMKIESENQAIFNKLIRIQSSMSRQKIRKHEQTI
jgi:hypothetical protein